MASILKHLKVLNEKQLYPDIIQVCKLALTASDQKPNYFTIAGKFQVNLYYADSLYHMKEYAQAESIYRQALQMRKTIKSKNSSTKLITETLEIVSETDIKYQIYLCCKALWKRKEAADILQSVNARQRTPKINMALGNMFKLIGMDRSAITCFKEVLRECPLAMEAMKCLLQLGVSGIEVNSLVNEVSAEIPWLSTWIKAEAQLHSRDYAKALQTYKTLDTHGLLKDDTSLTVNMAYCYHYMGEDPKAISLLQKAIRMDPSSDLGHDFLSSLLTSSSNKEHQTILERLIPDINKSLWTVKHWVILGNLMLHQKQFDKAVYFGQQAALLDTENNPEVLLLLANALFHLKKYQEAALRCTSALEMYPYRHDFHKCLVECYLNTNRLREAEAMALNACKELNFTAQACCLHASCLLSDPMGSVKNHRQIRRLLERAIVQDKNGHTNAIYMLAELLIRELQYKEVSQMLMKTLETQKPTSRIHQLLGECFINLQKDEEAFTHYTIALRLDPQNQRATEGLNSIGTKRDHYYSCNDSSYNSRRTLDQEPELEGESDSELWPGPSDMANFSG
ncbi:unnamed protein product [Ceutorhynchus assimilis]|uniref:Anaphase promoting complex subunit 7 n=1 Tax=Ceutorhynchus assimilis TaxID=467358 RepID=A0A9N9MFQ2_9CUCU|nr:unnamed protein product [Ceutorhynchus assimilis]